VWRFRGRRRRRTSLHGVYAGHAECGVEVLDESVLPDARLHSPCLQLSVEEVCGGAGRELCV
jgi:hypothetical protein